MTEGLFLLYAALVAGLAENVAFLVSCLEAHAQGPFTDEDGDEYVPSVKQVAIAFGWVALFGSALMVLWTGEMR